jgi:hypothetical protein
MFKVVLNNLDELKIDADEFSYENNHVVFTKNNPTESTHPDSLFGNKKKVGAVHSELVNTITEVE